jgi:hypothetical protein
MQRDLIAASRLNPLKVIPGFLGNSSCPFVSFVAVLAFFVVVPSCFAQDSWTLVTADFQSHPISLLSIDDKGINSPTGFVLWDNVLELDHAIRPAATDSAGFTLYLNGGDSAAGYPTAVANDTVSWRNDSFGDLDVPEDRVNAIVRSGQTAPGLEEPRKTDLVRLANGDQTSGVVENLADSTLAIQPAGADSPVNLSLDAISAILLADPDPNAAAAGRGLRVRLNDGSSLTFPVVLLATADASHLQAGFTEKTIHAIDLSTVASIEQTNGPVRWLTGLTPAEIVYHPYFTENYPPQFDHSVAEPNVSIRDKFPGFRHGIGVHSYTKLTYAVPDGFEFFRTQFAVDRIVGSDMSRADVNVRILVDDKIVKQFPHLRFGPVSEPVTVNVGNGKTLSLEVDYGDNLDAQGRFVWLDPAFVRPTIAIPGNQ